MTENEYSRKAKEISVLDDNKHIDYRNDCFFLYQFKSGCHFDFSRRSHSNVNGTGSDRQELVLFQFRLPGIILALLIGAGLAVSGTIMQGITQNGLADPGILGINSGAGFAIVLFLYFFQGVIPATSALSTYMLPFVALIGAFTAAVLIYAIAWKKEYHRFGLCWSESG